MPLSFLAPVFLAGLAALIVPVIVHLSSRPRKEVVRFPSLMFLDRVEYRDARKRRIRDPLLFALRALAVILVAGAFARPYLDRPDAPAVAIDGGREVVVLLDRSASMAGGGRMDRARQAVDEVAASLRRGDRATLVAFDHGAEALARATDQPATLRSLADGVRPGHGGTRFTPALRLAESILDGSPLPEHELVLISDFPRSAWDPDAGVVMPPRTTVRTVDVAGGPGDALPVAAAVVDASFARERFQGRERVRATARLINHGDTPHEAAVTLVIEGRDLARRTVTVPPAAGATLTFDAVTLPDHPVRGAFRLDATPAPFDAFHFVVAATRGPRVRVVQERGTAPRAGLYLARALQAGAAFDLDDVAPAGLTDALPTADVVILNDADPSAGDAAARLRTWVEAGGGLVVVMGERLTGRGLAGLLPGSPARTRDRTGDGGGTLARLEADHPVFAAFRGGGGAGGGGVGGSGGSGGITGARFFRYRGLDLHPAARVLARYDDGAPALVSMDVGRGRVLALTAPLDGSWSDLVLQPAFVPLVHGLVRHAAGAGAGPPAWHTVGDVVDIGPMLVPGPQPAAVVLAPGGDRLPVGPDAALLRLDVTGFYEVRDPRSASSPPLLAVNADPAEAEPATLDPGELRSALSPGEAIRPLVSGAPVDRERRQSLWWWVLLAAFLVLVAETLLGNTSSRRGRPA